MTPSEVVQIVLVAINLVVTVLLYFYGKSHYYFSGGKCVFCALLLIGLSIVLFVWAFNSYYAIHGKYEASSFAVVITLLNAIFTFVLIGGMWGLIGKFTTRTKHHAGH